MTSSLRSSTGTRVLRPALVVIAMRLVAVLAFALAPACSRSTPARPAPPAPAERVEAIRAGTSGDYPPLSLWRDDRVEGFAPSLLEEFARANRMNVTWTRFTWPKVASDLAAGRFDVASDGITVRPERSVIGRFTVPIARSGAVLLVRRPRWANALEVTALDRPDFRVVVNHGGHLERVTRGLFHSATITAIPDNTGVRDALATGAADAAMTNTFEAPLWEEGLSGIERVGPLTNDITALWVRADRAELATKLDEWLLSEEASGRLAQLRLRTLGGDGGGATAVPLEALLAATSERLSVMPLVAAAKRHMGKALEDTAQEERVVAAAIEAVKAAAAAHEVPPPPPAQVAAFFRAQIAAAKDVQAGPVLNPRTKFDLEAELRPAIARITARMAFLIVRLPRDIDRSALLLRARHALADSGVREPHLRELATALADLADR